MWCGDEWCVLLGDASSFSEVFEKITEVWTNGTGSYCMTAQEDNATLEVPVRMAVHRSVGFGRVIIMRTGKSNDEA